MTTYGSSTTVGGLDMTNFMEETIVEGLRVPAQLNSVAATNFVLTQEKGKLKPKDLKAAIERNRAEKKRRAEEQEKIRKEGGGVGPGMLDLRSILADDRLNISEGDAFKRQLREMAFLADVEDVQKLEVEKGFRISEVYLGSPHLSQEDIETVLKQREEAALFKKRSEWRSIQQRMNTECYTPHQTVRAGAPLDVSQTCQATLTPHFDANRNDIWAKRMNTLRRFISLVGKWIMRRRIVHRISTFRQVFHDAGCFTPAQVQEFIVQENANHRSKGSSLTVAKSNNSKDDASSKISWADKGKENTKPQSLAELVCSMPNEVLVARSTNESKTFDKYEVTADMLRRVLFPKFSSDQTAELQTMQPPTEMKDDCKFDDRTYFQLKVRPEYVALRCSKHEVPVTPITFSACNTKKAKIGAPEEYPLRYAADQHTDSSEIELLRPLSEPEAIEKISVSAVEPSDEPVIKPEPEPYEAEFTSPGPWLSDEPVWNSNEINYFRTRPDFRTYGEAPQRNETEPDYHLRPYARPLLYDQDNSLRSAWLKHPGFGSVNVYMMGACETRDTNIPGDLLAPPTPGPTLIDFYFPDHDRHTSGLNCFEHDHYRGLHDDDLGVKPMQHRQDPEDHLTDSESDEEDAYEVPKPTIRRIRKMLVTDQKEQTAAAEAPASPSKKPKDVEGGDGSASAAVSVAPDEESAVDEGAGEQVELLRDRKIIDMETYLLKLRQKTSESIANRLTELSSASKCLAHRLPVQVPFHTYEQDVYTIHENRKPVMNNTYIEPGVVSSKVKTRSVANGDDISLMSGDTTLKSP